MKSIKEVICTLREGWEKDGVIRGGSVKEVVLSKFFKREEDLAKGRGPSNLGEQLNETKKWKCTRHVRDNEWAPSAGSEV